DLDRDAVAAEVLDESVCAREGPTFMPWSRVTLRHRVGVGLENHRTISRATDDLDHVLAFRAHPLRLDVEAVGFDRGEHLACDRGGVCGRALLSRVARGLDQLLQEADARVPVLL